MKDLLPIGSVVLLKDATKKLVIIGVLQVNAEQNKMYDYLAVPYPEGYLGSDNNYLFNIVVLVFNKLNKDIEDYIETSLSEGLEVKLYVRGREGFGTGDVIPPEVKKNFNNQNTQ